MSDITNLSTLSPDQQADIYFLAGINATGTVGATSFQTWARDTPPTYTQTFANWGIWNNDANGVAQPTEAGYYRTVGSFGGTVTYAFDPAADFTTTQQSAIIAGLTLWSDEVGINFKQVSNATTADLLFESNDGNGGGGFAESPDDGNTVGDTDVAINLTPTVPNGGQAVISLGVGDAFGAFGSFASGGDSYSAMIHEIGHLLGLGHAGPYGDGEPDQDPEASQFNEFDSDQWSIMSYLTPYDTAATYYSQYTVKGTNWSYANATTPQMDDILAAQLLYGQSTSSTFGGGQTFGFHCNITDAAEPFFDFTINTAPVITIYDTGIGNTLDLSGYSMACNVNLNPGSFSSVGGLTNNVGIAYGTRIDSAIGGAGNDSFIVNADPDTIDGGGGKNTVIFGGDEASYVIADPEPGLVTVTSGSIVDDLTNIQYLQFADATLLTGTADIGTVFSWTLAAGGSFDSAESWRPTAVPSTLDTAQFLIPNSFTVSGDGMPGYLLVDDDVTFTGSIEAAGLDGQSNAFEVGDTVGAFGSVSLVSGATLDIDKYSVIGVDGDGTISFVNGASGAFNGFDIADAGPANSLVADSGLVTVDGAGTMLTLVGGGNVGNAGNGTLAVSDGASVQELAAPVTYDGFQVGEQAGSTGTVTVTSGATLSLGMYAQIGGSGIGLVSFADGASGSLTGLQYYGSGGYGPAEAAYIGGSGGSGTLSLAGSQTTVTADAGIGVGEYAGGTGLVILTNGAELAIEHSGESDVGGGAGSFGTVEISGGAQSTSDWFVGSFGYGSIDITTGGTVDSYDALFGEFSGAVGVGVIDDGLWDALNSMAIGAFGGSGTLTVQDSGTLAVGSGGLSVAGYPGATGLLIVNGGTVNVAGGNLSTGAGTATIITESNGVINVTGAITIGGSGSAYAAVTNSGSLLDFGSDITVANLGTLALDASAVINTALTLNGGTLNALGSLDVPVSLEITGGTTADPSALIGVGGSDLSISHGVTFESGANAVLLLGRAFDTSTTLYDVAAGDTLDVQITGTFYNTASYDTATGQLLLSDGTDTLTLDLADDGYSADSFLAASDSDGGTDVVMNPAVGTIYSWVNPAGGGFTDSGNWNPTGVPGTLDTAQFLIPGTFTVSGDGTPGYVLADDDVTFTGSIQVAGLSTQFTAFEVGGGGTAIFDGGTLFAQAEVMVGDGSGNGLLEFIDGAAGTMTAIGTGLVAGTERAAALNVAYGSASGSGTLDVSGSGSSVTLIGGAYIGEFGAGTVAISDGATFVSEAAPVLFDDVEVGVAAGSSGTITVDSGGTLSLATSLTIGRSGTGLVSFSSGATGTLTGLYSDATTGTYTAFEAVGLGGAGSSGTLSIDGSLTTVTAVGGIKAGNGAGGSGVVSVSNGGTLAINALPVSEDADNIYNPVALGNAAGSSGTMEVTGGAQVESATAIYVGAYGSGSLEITSGASVYSTSPVYPDVGPSPYYGGVVGGAGTAVGVALIDNGLWAVGHGFAVGALGNGTLTVQNQGTLALTDGDHLSIGDQAGGVGLLVVSDGFVDAADSPLYVSAAVGSSDDNTTGESDAGGSGTLEVEAGSTVTAATGLVAGLASGTGSIDVNNATLTFSGDLSTGAGTSTVTVEGDGISVGGGITIGGGGGGALFALTDAGSLIDTGGGITVAALGTLEIDATAMLDPGSAGLTLAGGTLYALASHTFDFGITILSGTPSAITGAAGAQVQFTGGVDFSSSGLLTLGAAFNPATEINNFLAGDTLDIAGQVFNTASYDTATSQLILSENNDPLALNIADNGYSADSFSAYSDNNGGTDVSLGPPPCYVVGTLIATPAGDRPVESLRAGDRVLLAGGGTAPVVWVGHRRVDPARHPRSWEIHPIRIQQGAIAHDLPRRDLLVSPDHALLLDGVLIEARRLVNGATIRQDTACGPVHYLHVELPRHDVLLAEGVAAESYLDTGNRTAFASGDAPAALHPSFATARPAAEAAVARAIWRRLAARALALGYALPQTAALSTGPDLAVLAGTRRLKPTHAAGHAVVFAVPPGLRVLRLRSRASVPADTAPWLDDRRRLGIAVRRIRLRGGADCHDVALDGPALGGGWWAPEGPRDRPWRWTDGDAELRLGTDCGMLELELHGRHAYPVASDHLGHQFQLAREANQAVGRR